MTRCFLGSLDTDIFLDHILIYLSAEELICLRRVCKFFLMLTEECSIWKRLLIRTTIPLPPVPPIPRYAFDRLSGFEAEKVITRAISLDKNWRSPCPAPLQKSLVGSHYYVNSMVLVPGGRYLVASVRDAANQEQGIVIYVLEHRFDGVPIAMLPVKAKAYQLQAKYLSIPRAPEQKDISVDEGDHEWVPGIAISYVFSRPKSSADRQNLVHEYNAEYDMDIDVPLVHECNCVHVPLDDLEYLVDADMELGSQRFIHAAKDRRSPFRQLFKLRSKNLFGSITMNETSSGPYLAVVKPPNAIILRPLLPGVGPIELRCQIVPNRVQTIKAVQILSDQQQILVVRRTEPLTRKDNPVTNLELYDIPVNTSAQLQVTIQHAVEVRKYTDRDVIHIQIPDMDVPLLFDRSFRGEFSSDRYCGQPLAIHGRAMNPLCIVTRLLKPLVVPRSDDDPLMKKSRFITRYSLSDCTTLLCRAAPEGIIFGLLPGSYRSIIFASSSSDVSPSPKLQYMTCWSLDDHYPIPEEMQHSRTKRAKLRPARYLDIEFYGFPTAALAWDEFSGRLCMSVDNVREVEVIDFARTPSTDSQGLRAPLYQALDNSIRVTEGYSGRETGYEAEGNIEGDDTETCLP